MFKRKIKTIETTIETFKINHAYDGGVVYNYVIPAGGGRMRVLVSITKQLLKDKISDKVVSPIVAYFTLNNTRDELAEQFVKETGTNLDKLKIYEFSNDNLKLEILRRYIDIIQSEGATVVALVIDNTKRICSELISKEMMLEVERLNKLSELSRKLNIPIITSTQSSSVKSRNYKIKTPYSDLIITESKKEL